MQAARSNQVLLLSCCSCWSVDSARRPHLFRPCLLPRPTLQPYQALILHIQYLVIVTRPPVDYPQTVTAVAAVLSALTWAGDWWGFSPACLLPNQDSAGQAKLALAAGILVPCAVLLASLALWAVRCGACVSGPSTALSF